MPVGFVVRKVVRARMLGLPGFRLGDAISAMPGKPFLQNPEHRHRAPPLRHSLDKLRIDPTTSVNAAIPGGVAATCSGRRDPSALTALSRRCAIDWYTGGGVADSPRCAPPCAEDSLRELVVGRCLPSGGGLGGTTTDGFPMSTGGGGLGLGAIGAGPA